MSWSGLLVTSTSPLPFIYRQPCRFDLSKLQKTTTLPDTHDTTCCMLLYWCVYAQRVSDRLVGPCLGHLVRVGSEEVEGPGQG